MPNRTISLYHVLGHALQVSGFDVLLAREGPDLRHTGWHRHNSGDFVIVMRPASDVAGSAEIVIILLAGQEVFRAVVKREWATSQSQDAVLAIWGSHQRWRAAFMALPISGG